MLKIHGYSGLHKIHEGSNSAIYRAVSIRSGEPVIVKAAREEQPSAALINRYRQEYEITRGIESEGVLKVHALENHSNSLFLIFENFEGESLKSILERRKVGIEEFLLIGAKLTQTLHEIDRAGIIHRDINPSNVIYNPKTGRTKIIDFGLSLKGDSFNIPNVLEGTIGYISPEQTGRMNKRIDWRTDFYSLGVTFYEMLTGRILYDSVDLQQLIHDHIARIPIAPHKIDPRIPNMLSEIIMKLLAKNADDRYQSAIGIKADLEECLRRFKESSVIAPFPLARKDVSERFVLPGKLYGRDSEIETLLSSLDLIASGGKEIVAVSGAPGIGKTSLVKEFGSHVVQRNGRFVHSQFDQYARNIPYSAIIGALRGLIRQILAESDEGLIAWRENIQSALSPNCQVMIDLIPEIELIVGPQPPVPVLGSKETWNRFKIVFYDFVALFCKKEHPLIIFLDDMQWADLPSLGLIEIMMSLEGGALMLICAYRDNEVDNSHQFMQTLRQIPECLIKRIHLEPLDSNQIGDIISDIVRQQRVAVEPLAQFVKMKTGGNPFFVSEFLKALNSEKLLTFSTRDCRWHWHLGQINAKGFTENVADLIVGNIAKLPGKTQILLKYASMLGNEFDLEKLAILSEMSQVDAENGLKQAVHEGFVVHLNEDDFGFSHDRVQQAAYNMIHNNERCKEHLRAGRLFLTGIPADQREKNLFEIVKQFNKGKDVITSNQEKSEISDLNYRAGMKAKKSAAFNSAYQFFRAGIDLLDRDSWESNYSFTLAVYIEAAEAAYLSGQHDQLELLGEAILQNTRDVVDQVPFHITRVKKIIGQGKYREALDLGLDVLDYLGFKIPRNPTRLRIAFELVKLETVLAGKKPEEVAAFPELTDPHLLAILKLVYTLISVSYVSSPETMAIMTLKSVCLLVKRRVSCSNSIMLWGTYSVVILIGAMGKIERGVELSKIIALLADRPDAKEHEATTQYGYGFILTHRIDHIRNAFPEFLNAYRLGLEHGNFQYAAYGAYSYSMSMLLAGIDLLELEKNMGGFITTLARLKQERSLTGCQLVHQIIFNLRGQSADPCIVSGDLYKEEEKLPVHLQDRDMVTLFNAHFWKMFLCYLFGRNEEALRCSKNTEKYLSSQVGRVHFGFYHFYHSLVLLADMQGKPAGERRRIIRRVKHNQKILKKWEKHAPMNYSHKYLIVEAEICRVSGKYNSAAILYDQSIQLARDNRYLHEEGIANELAGRFYLSLKKLNFASLYLSEARNLYERWGATAKVKDMDERYPELLFLRSKIHSSEESVAATVKTPAGESSSFDVNTFVKASGAISQEINLEKLLSELIRIIMKTAGAQRGFIVLNDQGRLTIEVQGSVEATDEPVLKSIDINKSDQISVAIVHYVERTQKAIVIGDAVQEGQFTKDEYVIREKPLSILCMPIMNQATLTGILYLENNIASNAFTDQTVELLTILGSQAAISIENARLYARLKESEGNYRGLYENAVEGIFQCTPDGRVLNCNRSMARIMGFNSIEEFLAKAVNVFEVYENKLQRDEMIRELLENGQIIGFETRLSRRGSSVIWVAISARTVRDSDGTPRHFEGFLIDITAQKEKEIERREREAAQAASRSKGEFLARMGHEIRTPLNAILGFSKLLQDEELSNSARQNLAIINRSGEHLLSLINNILELAKVESGRISLKPSVFDIHELISDIDMMFRERTHQKGLGLTLNISKDTPRHVNADEGKIRQIFINLLGNALKFTREGAITIRVFPERTDEAMIMAAEVEDTGEGIAPEEMGRLFSPFEQTASGIQSRQGTGLGLAIVRQYLNVMGGDISVQSEPGRGSCFHFRFPVQVTQEPVLKEQRQARITGLRHGQGAIRILVVDDHEEQRRLISSILGAMGFEIKEAANGREALHIHSEWKPRIIMMDLNMPEMDGYRAVREIRNSDGNAFIIAVTASVLNTARQKAIADGFDAYIQKPFRHEEIIKAIETDGVEFTKSGEEQPVGEVSRISISAIPAELVEEMRKAAGEADIDTLGSLMKEMENHDPVTAEKLSEMMMRFDYEAILDRLSGIQKIMA